MEKQWVGAVVVCFYFNSISSHQPCLMNFVAFAWSRQDAKQGLTAAGCGHGLHCHSFLSKTNIIMMVL